MLNNLLSPYYFFLSLIKFFRNLNFLFFLLFLLLVLKWDFAVCFIKIGFNLSYPRDIIFIINPSKLNFSIQICLEALYHSYWFSTSSILFSIVDPWVIVMNMIYWIVLKVAYLRAWLEIWVNNICYTVYFKLFIKLIISIVYLINTWFLN